jgi:hypothetical protein
MATDIIVNHLIPQNVRRVNNVTDNFVKNRINNLAAF